MSISSFSPKGLIIINDNANQNLFNIPILKNKFKFPIVLINLIDGMEILGNFINLSIRKLYINLI